MKKKNGLESGIKSTTEKNYKVETEKSKKHITDAFATAHLRIICICRSLH